jgi:broad-specificity NMP kinase
LEKRLEKRGYSKQKIAENIMCEFLDACLIEAIEMEHKKHLHEIDTSSKKPAAIALEIRNILNGEKKSYGEIRWLE